MKWFNATKGFGFIAPNDESEEVFVHQSALDMGGFRSLWEVRAKRTGAGIAFSIFQRFAIDGTNSTARWQGYKVEFEVDHNGGRLRAKNVTGVGGVALVAPPRSFYRGSGKHEPCPGKPKGREKSETRGL